VLLRARTRLNAPSLHGASASRVPIPRHARMLSFPALSAAGTSARIMASPGKASASFYRASAARYRMGTTKLNTLMPSLAGGAEKGWARRRRSIAASSRIAEPDEAAT
jgi:hypothetical protein